MCKSNGTGQSSNGPEETELRCSKNHFYYGFKKFENKVPQKKERKSSTKKQNTVKITVFAFSVLLLIVLFFLKEIKK